MKTFAIIATVLACAVAVAFAGSSAVFQSGGYNNIVVAIKDSVSPVNCKTIINNIETAFTSGSKSLHEALGGKAYFRSVIVMLPSTWPDHCVGNLRVVNSQGETPDVHVGMPHPVHGDALWTQQSQGCGRPGDAVYASYRLFDGQRDLGKEIARQWAKYRYGVFDEFGYAGDAVYPACYASETSHAVDVNGCSDKPISQTRACDSINTTNAAHPEAKTSLMFSTAAQVTKFCDASSHDRYAPTKQNALCGRRSIMEVINTHPDFTKGVNFSGNQNLTPTFIYKKEVLTRYVVVIEDTKDMTERESWSFLRLAIRKWAIIDLPENTEVGLVSANDSMAIRLFPLSSVQASDVRDQVASNIPYLSSDARLACLDCAIKEAITMLETRAVQQGPMSSVIVVIATGTASNSPNLIAQVKEARNKNIRIATITYPTPKRSRSLDWMADMTGGISFTVTETQYKMEQSYLSTYFALTNTLRNIMETYYLGNRNNLSVEIYRRKLTNEGKSAVTGNFYLEDFMGEPAKFIVFTHNTETPLIKTITLTSPSGRVYSTRSDSLLMLKMLSVSAVINETGTWTYHIEQFHGNLQPHYVQVMARPLAKTSPVIRARAWTSGTTNPLAIYAEVKRGDYPVLRAKVEVTVTRPEVNGSNTHREKFDLLDTGSGDPDLMKEDGVYSRYFNPMIDGPGIYTFEITVTDSNNAFTWQHSMHRNLEKTAVNYESNCCGSFMTSRSVEQLNSFQRIIAPLSIAYTSEDLSSSMNVGRVGDLKVDVIKTELKARLAWTSPDMGGNSVARYEIRYSQSLRALLNEFDSAPVWTHGSPLPLAPGSETVFMMDMKNAAPKLLDQPIYVAIKGYGQINLNSVPGPISNWVRVLVPSPPPPPSSSVTTDSSSSSSAADPSKTAADQNIIPRIAREFEMNYDVVLPAAGGLMLLGLLFLVYCVFCAVKRNRKPEKQSPIKQEKSLNVSVIPNGNHGGGALTISSPMSASIKTELESRFEPCLIDTSDPKKRYSVAQYGPVAANDHHYNLQQQHQQQQPQPPYHHHSNGHLSVIGSATLTRVQKPLSPYQSWTASQLLHEHERRTSPYGQIGDFENQYPPPVPPLPAYQQQQLQQQQQQQQQKQQVNVENIYGTAPGHYQQQQNGLPPPGQYNNYHRNNMILFNQSLQGSLSSVSSGDKKKRNITMV